jgi:predicted ArsR family transcriptional regulator
MKPIDYRNTTWDEIQGRLKGDRQACYEGLRVHGPCTTRQLADRIGIDLLTVRPRVTELVQLGLAECGDEPGREGIYRALPLWQAMKDFQERARRATEPQLELFQ